MPGYGPPGLHYDRLEPMRHGSDPATSPQPCKAIPQEVVADGCPPEVVDLMAACWGESEKRPTFDIVMQILDNAASKMQLNLNASDSATIQRIAPQLLKTGSQHQLFKEGESTPFRRSSAEHLGSTNGM